VLEEISQQITKQRLRITQENIYHMIVCMTNYISQYLQQNGDSKLSNLINQVGKRILSIILITQTNDMNRAEQSSASDTRGQTILSDDIAEQLMPKGYHAIMHNEELKALERFVARERNTLTALTGNEEAAFVFNFISSTSAQHSYRESK
jgi:hypothetical protein